MQAEFDFTTLMIYRNFSNYSAWHRRSRLLPRFQSILGTEGLKAIVAADLKLIRSAYFTEPADQSCWFYLIWLLEFATSQFNDSEGLLARELDHLSELLAMEPEAPLALSAWINLATRHPSYSRSTIQEKLSLLRKCDPMRSGMYRDRVAMHSPA